MYECGNWGIKCSSHNFIDGEPPCCTAAEKDLGVLVDQNLKFDQHTATVRRFLNESKELIS